MENSCIKIIQLVLREESQNGGVDIDTLPPIQKRKEQDISNSSKENKYLKITAVPGNGICLLTINGWNIEENFLRYTFDGS